MPRCVMRIKGLRNHRQSFADAFWMIVSTCGGDEEKEAVEDVGRYPNPNQLRVEDLNYVN